MTCASALPHCVLSAHLGIQDQQTRSEYFMELVSYLTDHLIDAMSREPDIEVRSCIATACKQVIQYGSLVQGTMDQYQAIFDREVLDTTAARLLSTFKASFQRRAVKKAEMRVEAEESATGGLDEEELEALEDALESEEVFMFHVSEILGALMKTHTVNYLPSFEAVVMPTILEMAAEHMSPSDRKTSIFVIDDIIDFGGEAAASLYNQLIPILLHHVTDEGAQLRQAAVYGLGAAAGAAVTAFAPFAAEAVQRMQTIISHEKSREGENEQATDNAVSALGKIYLSQANALTQEGIDPNDVLGLWLSYLPLRADREESISVNRQFCNMLQSSEYLDAIMGQDSANLTHVLSVIAQVLGTDFIDTQTANEMQSILCNMQQQLPAQLMQQSIQQLPAECIIKIEQVLA